MVIVPPSRPNEPPSMGGPSPSAPPPEPASEPAGTHEPIEHVPIPPPITVQNVPSNTGSAGTQLAPIIVHMKR